MPEVISNIVLFVAIGFGLLTLWNLIGLPSKAKSTHRDSVEVLRMYVFSIGLQVVGCYSLVIVWHYINTLQ